MICVVPFLAEKEEIEAFSERFIREVKEKQPRYLQMRRSVNDFYGKGPDLS